MGHRLLGKRTTPGNCDGSHKSWVTKNQLLSQRWPPLMTSARGVEIQLCMEMHPFATVTVTAVEGK